MRKFIFGTVVALAIAVICLAGTAAAQDDTSGTVLTDDIRP